MKKTTTAAIAAALAACTPVTGGLQTGPGPNASAATWQMPWQLNPATVETEGKGEQTRLAYSRGSGWIRGTSEALASVGRPLPDGPAPNRAVETCRSTVEGEARKLGARQVEATSAGVERRIDKGYQAPVLMRVTYPRLFGYEVRLSTLECVVTRDEAIVDAWAVGER